MVEAEVQLRLASLLRQVRQQRLLRQLRHVHTCISSGNKLGSDSR